jgi:hypothetical protein
MMLQPEELSKLPKDAAYWSGLESRIVAAALEDRAKGGMAWHAPLARGAWALATAAAAAAMALTFLPRDAAATTAAAVAPVLLGPSSANAPALEAMLRMESAPAIADLLRPSTPEASR